MSVSAQPAGGARSGMEPDVKKGGPAAVSGRSARAAATVAAGRRDSTTPHRLVKRPRPARPPRRWDGPAAVLFGDPGTARSGGPPWQVLGGPGTGKTALVTDLAAARIVTAADPASVLVLAPSRRAASSLRDGISHQLLRGSARLRASREPVVRTVHSYAFAVLRAHAAAHGNPPPRLLTAAELDAFVREMLQGDIEDQEYGAQLWPGRLAPALGLDGFAREIRELMARATERGIGPEDLVKLGHKHSRPEWVAAGKFAERCEQTLLLRWSVGVEAPEASAPALDAAALVGSALSALTGDPELLHSERARVRYLFVDDAQHLDPLAAQLVRLLAAGTAATVLTGDPDQAVFGFRGADPGLLNGTGEPADRRIVLPHNHRSAERVAATVNWLAGRLPGSAAHRGASAMEDGGAVAVRLLATPAQEAWCVADQLRRAYLHDGVPWSRMAVIVRSTALSGPALRRVLLSAGVPAQAPPAAVPVSRRRGSAWVLPVLKMVSGMPSGPEDALALLGGPLGGADEVALRRLRRGIRRSALAAGNEQDSSTILLMELLSPAPELAAALTDVEAAPIRRVRKVLARARAAHAAGQGLEEILWAAWTASGLQRRWTAQSAAGGSGGVQADAELDAMVALFAVAAEYVDSLPRASLAGFVDYLERQGIPVSARVDKARPAGVEIVSAHAAAGREWDVVVVAGVQEGLWPGPRMTGGVLRTGELLDLLSGTAGDGERLSQAAPRLAEERRLFLLACSRARKSLLVTAVESAAGDALGLPSRFVEELAGQVGGERGRLTAAPRRVLAAQPVIAELRRAVCDSSLDEAVRERAARQLARLASAGVRGAHPREWYGLKGSSTAAPLWESGTVTVSPSAIDRLRACPLRWALEQHGGGDSAAALAARGSVVHALAQALANGVPEPVVQESLRACWKELEPEDNWHSRRELTRTVAMLDTFQEWLRASRTELSQAAVEVAVECLLEGREPGEPDVRLRGRIDRLEYDPEGRAVVVDLKTGKTPITKAAAQDHAQLAAYQIAAASGGIAGAPTAEPGGGRLVYIAKPHAKDGAAQRMQGPLDAEGLARWRTEIHQAAAATQGPVFLAIVNDGCRHCPLVASCPAQEQGRQVSAWE